MNLPARDYARMLSALVETACVTPRDDQRLDIDTGSQMAVEMILNLATSASKVMVIGNGGSAAIASHMVNDLSKSAKLRALAFNDFSLMTDQANDHGYARAYEACIEQWAQPGDLLIAISSSGQSENIQRAVHAARKLGASVITFTGFRSDNALRLMGDLNFHISAEAYGLVELAHSVIAHHLTDAVCHAQKQQQILALQAQIVTKPVTLPLQSQEIQHDISFKAARSDHRRSGLRRSRASA